MSTDPQPITQAPPEVLKHPQGEFVSTGYMNSGRCSYEWVPTPAPDPVAETVEAIWIDYYNTSGHRDVFIAKATPHIHALLASYAISEAEAVIEAARDCAQLVYTIDGPSYRKLKSVLNAYDAARAKGAVK